MDAVHRDEYLKVLDKRLEDFSVAAAKRVKRVVKAAAPPAWREFEKDWRPTMFEPPEFVMLAR